MFVLPKQFKICDKQQPWNILCWYLQLYFYFKHFWKFIFIFLNTNTLNPRVLCGAVFTRGRSRNVSSHLVPAGAIDVCDSGTALSFSPGLLQLLTVGIPAAATLYPFPCLSYSFLIPFPVLKTIQCVWFCGHGSLETLELFAKRRQTCPVLPCKESGSCFLGDPGSPLLQSRCGVDGSM